MYIGLERIQRFNNYTKVQRNLFNEVGKGGWEQEIKIIWNKFEKNQQLLSFITFNKYQVETTFTSAREL